MGFKSRLAKLGIIESEPEVVKEPVIVHNQEKSLAATINIATTSNKELLNKLIAQIDTVDGFSFIEFFETNKDTNDMQTALKNAEAMAGLTKETLLLQATESFAKLDQLYAEQTKIGEHKKSTLIENISTERDQLTDEIAELENKLIEKRNQFSKLDSTSSVNEINQTLNDLTNSRDSLRLDLERFINKIK